jgi:hypothetical protein
MIKTCHWKSITFYNATSQFKEYCFALMIKYVFWTEQKVKTLNNLYESLIFCFKSIYSAYPFKAAISKLTFVVRRLLGSCSQLIIVLLTYEWAQCALCLIQAGLSIQDSATSMRRSTVQSIPLQWGFLDLSIVCKLWIPLIGFALKIFIFLISNTSAKYYRGDTSANRD